MPSNEQSLARLRQIIGGWPEVTEKESHGAPTFWGGRKTFCNLQPHEDRYGGPAIWIKATHEAQAELVEGDPERYFVPPYKGPSGWVGVRLEGVRWPMVEQLLEDGYRLVAPRRAVDALDSRRAAAEA